MESRHGTGARIGRWIPGSALVALLLIGVLASMYLLTDPPHHAHAEGGPIEWLQLGVWGVAILMLGAAVLRGPLPIDRVGCFWLFTVAALAMMRELDLHHLPKPENIGAMGMRFQTRWWLNFDVPIAPKLLWGSVGLALMGILLVPVVQHWRAAARLLWGRDPAAVLFGLSTVMCFGGFVMDDLLRHAVFMTEDERQAAEEALEALGAAAFAGVGLAVVSRPVSRRLQDAGAASED
jgi:hypothetical protein